MIFVFRVSDLLYSVWRSLGPSMLLQMALFRSFLWLSNIPLFIRYHIFFIHSSVNGHLGCFRVLAIVHSAAMNIGVHVSFRLMVFSGYRPKSGIAGEFWFLILCRQWMLRPGPMGSKCLGVLEVKLHHTDMQIPPEHLKKISRPYHSVYRVLLTSLYLSENCLGWSQFWARVRCRIALGASLLFHPSPPFPLFRSLLCSPVWSIPSRDPATNHIQVLVWASASKGVSSFAF